MKTNQNSILTPALIRAATHIGAEVYSQPYPRSYKWYKPNANFYYTCSDGTVIHRPNHNIANALRGVHYLDAVINYYKASGKESVQDKLQLLDESEHEKIRYLMLFYTSGRENELGFNDDPKLAMQYRTNAAKNFLNSFQSGDYSPFKDEAEAERYAELLENPYKKHPEDNDENKKNNMISLLLLSCHELDLLRCFPDEKLQKTLLKNFRENSRFQDDRNLQLLIYYAQNCIIATGDKLRTEYEVQDIHGIQEKRGFSFGLKEKGKRFHRTGNFSVSRLARPFDEEKFKQSSRCDEDGITQTLQTLSSVESPQFYAEAVQRPEHNPDEILALIKQGRTAVRIFNGGTDDIALRLETEQLTRPETTRPLRPAKLARRHDTYVTSTGRMVQREEKEYRPLDQQAKIGGVESIPQYREDKPVSKQEDRGKPKATVFSKKSSYSILPRSGKLPIFRGRYQDRIFNSYIPVGLLHDTNEMHKKGEQYIWAEDVRTSGLSAYFWLATNEGQVPSSRMPGLDEKRRARLTFNQLQDTINAPEQTSQKYNEVLFGASAKSLQAVFAVKDDRLHRLAALHAATTLHRDYRQQRPILIVDGVNEPKAYTPAQIQADLTQALNNNTSLLKRIKNWFFPSSEVKLLKALFAPIGKTSLQSVNKDDIDECIASLSRLYSEKAETVAPSATAPTLPIAKEENTLPGFMFTSRKTYAKERADETRVDDEEQPIILCTN